MSRIYQLYTQSDYDATTKVTGSGQSQAWDTSTSLGDAGVGSVKFTSAGTPPIYAGKTFTESGTNYLTYRVYYDFSNFTITDAFNSEFLDLYSSVDYLSRISMLRSGSSYLLRCGQYNDGRAASTFTNYAISNKGPDYLEVRMVRPATDSSSDGTVTYVSGNDGTLGTQTGLDNYDEFPLINQFNLGLGLLNGNTQGVGDAYIGKLLVTNDANPIGPFLSYRHRPRPAAIMKKRQRIKGYRCG